jgi:hypothetical protein
MGLSELHDCWGLKTTAERTQKTVSEDNGVSGADPLLTEPREYRNAYGASQGDNPLQDGLTKLQRRRERAIQICAFFDWQPCSFNISILKWQFL